MKNKGNKILTGLLFVSFNAAYGETNNAIECARKSLQVANLTTDQSIKLCVNGGTTENVDCAITSIKELQLTADQAVELCTNKALRLQNMVNFMNALPK